MAVSTAARPLPGELKRTFGSRFEALAGETDNDLVHDSRAIKQPKEKVARSLYWTQCSVCSQFWASCEVLLQQPFKCPHVCRAPQTPVIAVPSNGASSEFIKLYRYPSAQFYELIGKLEQSTSGNQRRSVRRKRRRRRGVGIPSHCYEHHACMHTLLQEAMQDVLRLRQTIHGSISLQQSARDHPGRLGSVLRNVEGPIAQQMALRHSRARRSLHSALPTQHLPRAPGLTGLHPQPKPNVLPFYTAL
eukprot:TRINITY_DN17691_c0_g1_i1.p1 TRINITY_DN17691_c0_g1~~TRINITY_DN17691_c0_g1_i1.p1  ORF type:complete len:247 (+),score=9.77 TRINITY_DN17691_c0_g1_i1:109-849(+)